MTSKTKVVKGWAVIDKEIPEGLLWAEVYPLTDVGGAGLALPHIYTNKKHAETAARPGLELIKRCEIHYSLDKKK